MQILMDESTKNRIPYCGTMVNVGGACFVEDLFPQTPADKTAAALFRIHNRVVGALQRDYNFVYKSYLSDNCSAQINLRKQIEEQHPRTWCMGCMLHVQHNCTKGIDSCLSWGLSDCKKNAQSLVNKIFNTGAYYYYREICNVSENQNIAKQTCKNSLEWGAGYLLIHFCIENEQNILQILWHQDCQTHFDDDLLNYFLDQKNWDKFKFMERCYYPFHCNKLFLLSMYALLGKENITQKHNKHYKYI